MRNSTTWIFGAALAVVTLGGVANANGFGAFYGNNYGAVYQGLDSRVPYFAAHPPVYYSYQVPRTYGYTPFAYPPTVLTPEIELAPQPEVITNPHYKPASGPSSTDQLEKTVSAPTFNGGPRMIDNPYVHGAPRVLPASQAL